MNRAWLLLAVMIVPPAAGQNPADTAGASDSIRLENLRQQVQERYNARAHQVLGLSGAQAARFDSTQDRVWPERRSLMLERRRVNQALQWQMRPGVAANADSVSKLLETRRRTNAALLSVDDKEDRELAGYLTPVQRAQYQQFRQGFRERVGEVMRHGGIPGRGRPQGPRAGARPRRRP
ncbi:MAG TPA: hypothetical protein VFK78_10720 [Gemmatimonadales bacterium]|nr:hypothetical protein [Gemmatimonadales bacterium]